MIDRFERLYTIYMYMWTYRETVISHEYLGPGHEPVNIDIWRGYTKDIAESMGLALVTVHNEITHLTTMQCLTILRRGTKHHKSVYLLHFPPTEEMWEAQQERNTITGRMEPVTRSQRNLDALNRLRRRVDSLETTVTMLQERLERLERVAKHQTSRH